MCVRSVIGSAWVVIVNATEYRSLRTLTSSFQAAGVITHPFDVIKTHRQLELGEALFGRELFCMIYWLNPDILPTRFVIRYFSVIRIMRPNLFSPDAKLVC